MQGRTEGRGAQRRTKGRGTQGRTEGGVRNDTLRGGVRKDALKGRAHKDAQRGHAMMRRGAGVRVHRGRGGSMCNDDAREMGARGMRRVVSQDDEKALSLA